MLRALRAGGFASLRGDAAHIGSCRRLAIALLVSLLFTLGCSDHLRRKELENVAKDWCLLIRASQVIPVYPLTEDLQPGDIFLVTTPIQQQEDLYKARGFLPFDQHFGRLHELGYFAFYDGSYGVGDTDTLPHRWQFPATPPPPTATAPAATQPTRHTAHTDWELAPRAAFPTYNFKVKSGGGIKLALPLSGVPVALSMMQTDSASGSAAIKDCYTYGLSFDLLIDGVQAWAGEPARRKLLSDLKKESSHEIFIRVVSRVYLTGNVVVSMINTSAGSASASGGVPQPVTIPELKDQQTATNYGEALKVASKNISSATGDISALKPGGSIALAWATERSVAMSETFDRPLIIGYLAFDFPILTGGALGAPRATRGQLEGTDQATLDVPIAFSDYLLVRGRVESFPDATRDAIYAAAADALGGVFKTKYDEAIGAGQSTATAFSRARIAYSMAQGHPPSHFPLEVTQALEREIAEQSK